MLLLLGRPLRGLGALALGAGALGLVLAQLLSLGLIFGEDE